MTYRNRFKEALEAIGRALGSPLSLDDGGAAAFTFAGGSRAWLSVSSAEESATLFSPVASVHGNDRAALFETALRINADPLLTGRDWLGYDARGEELVLVSQIKGEVEPEGLATRLNVFLRLGLQMRQQLVEAGGRPRQPRTENHAPGDDLSGLMIIRA